MLKGFFLTIFGVAFGFAIAAVPACAADDIEAKVQVCAACHGQNGVPVDPKTIPIIWGQQQSIAQEDLRKIAAHFAAKSWPTRHASTASASPPNGIAQCQLCHQPNFVGGPPAPRLAGLSYEYLVAAMRSFAVEERTNNGDMPKFMQALTDSERDAMARFLSAL